MSQLEVDNSSFPEEAEASEKNFDFRDNLRDLREALAIQRELGGSLSPDDAVRLTGMEPEALHNFLSGQEVMIDAKGEDVMAEIESALLSLEKDGQSEVSLLRRFANNKSVRAAFITLMLLAKFAPQAQGAENYDQLKEKTGEKKELSHDIKHEPDPDKTYNLSAADFEVSEPGSYYKGTDAKTVESKVDISSRLVNLELANYFATDQAEIMDATAITADFEAFLHRITPENAEQFIAADFKLFGSSDERPTSNWEGSNETLTSARLAALDKLLSQILHNYEFKNLSEELKSKIQAKVFLHEMPASETGSGRGVIYITDLDNPETGNKYTKAEAEAVKENNPDKYKDLLDDCRHITFSASLNNVSILKTLDPKVSGRGDYLPELKLHPVDQPKFENLPAYNNVSLLFDNSPSVGNSYNYMAKLVEQQNFQGLKINFSTFSNNLDKMKKFDNPTDVADAIRSIEYNGNWEEKALDVAAKALDKMPEGEKNAIFVMTDENFQDISWEKLQSLRALAVKKTADVYFYYGDDKSKTVRQVSLDDLEDGFKYQAMENISSRVISLSKLAEKRIDFLTQQKHNQENLIAKATDRVKTPALEKSLIAYQERLTDLDQKITEETQKLSKLTESWEGGDLVSLFAQQENFNLKVGGGKFVQNFNETMKLNVSADNLGFSAMDLASL